MDGGYILPLLLGITRAISSGASIIIGCFSSSEDEESPPANKNYFLSRRFDLDITFSLAKLSSDLIAPKVGLTLFGAGGMARASEVSYSSSNKSGR